MFDLIREFLLRSWVTLCELAPWLLLGMLISGLMHVLLPKNFVRRRFRGLTGVVQSVLLGVPLPLCSCGVVPAGIGLKNDGASDGASVGFLISTPQTGVDSILVSASFFGWPFAIFKMLAAAITGMIGGWVTEWASPELDRQPTTEDMPQTVTAQSGKLAGLIEHALEVLQSIWLWLLIGILVSALIGVLELESVFENVSAAGLLPAMLLMLLIAVPLYVCATASVPIAAVLVQSGLPPAVALVFLMAGPATNVTTIGAIGKRFGRRVLLIYLLTIIVGSFLAAIAFDGLLTATVASSLLHQHDHQSWWSATSAIVLIGLVLWVAGRQLFANQKMATREDGVIEIDVAGMHCGNCVNRIRKGIEAIEGVETVSVNLSAGKVLVSGDATRENISATIASLGFDAD